MDRIHVEVWCSTIFYLREKQRVSPKGIPYRDYIDYFEKEKFDHKECEGEDL